ncbi:polyadenylate-binding protein 1-like [Tachysurus ichikawai]
MSLFSSFQPEETGYVPATTPDPVHVTHNIDPVYYPMYEPVYDTVYEPLYDLVYDLVYDPVYEPVYNHVYDPMYDLMYDPVYDPMYNLVYDPVYYPVYNPVYKPVDCQEYYHDLPPDVYPDSPTGVELFVRGLDSNVDEYPLYKKFLRFGNISRAKVVESKGYGYVQFESQEAAASAIKRLNGMLLNDQYVTIEYFKDRDERKPEVRPQHQANNLFIKNLDCAIDDECLRTVFGQFGTVMNAKVMMENGLSKGFGFVSYTSSQDATTAKKALNGRIWGRKQVYVGVAL